MAARPSIRIDVKADTKAAIKFFRELDEDAIARATANTLNVVARTVRREATDEIAKIRKVKRSTFIRLALVRASKWLLRAEVIAEGLPIPLKEYGAKEVGAGVRVNVMGTRKIIPGAFIVEKFGGHVFERFGERVQRKTRAGKKVMAQKIRKLFGPSIPTAFLRATVQAKLRAVISRDYRRVMDEKLNQELVKLKAKHGTNTGAVRIK